MGLRVSNGDRNVIFGRPIHFSFPNNRMTSHPTSSPPFKISLRQSFLSLPLTIPSIHYQRNGMIETCVLGDGGVGHVLFILHGDWLLLAWAPFGSAGPIRLIENGRWDDWMGERHSSVLHDGSSGHRRVLVATNPTIGKQTLWGINLSKTIWLLSGWKTPPGPNAQPCNTRAAWRKDGRRQIEGWGGSVWWSSLGRKTDRGWMWWFRRWDGVDCLCHFFPV